MILVCTSQHKSRGCNVCKLAALSVAWLWYNERHHIPLSGVPSCGLSPHTGGRGCRGFIASQYVLLFPFGSLTIYHTHMRWWESRGLTESPENPAWAMQWPDTMFPPESSRRLTDKWGEVDTKHCINYITSPADESLVSDKVWPYITPTDSLLTHLLLTAS